MRRLVRKSYLHRCVMAGMNNIIDSVVEQWEAVIDDMEATANDYRESGWTVVELHPGDVTIRAEDNEFDVLVPDNEFDQLEATVPETEFDNTELFRAEDGGVVFVLAVTVDTDNDIAVCCPLYYDINDAHELYERIDGGLTTAIRTLSDDQRITIDHDDPDPFFPDVVTEPASDPQPS